jgi:hypothetical protein
MSSADQNTADRNVWSANLSAEAWRSPVARKRLNPWRIVVQAVVKAGSVVLEIRK